MRPVLSLAAAVAALALAGCAAPALDDPVFKAGYDAGCAMGGTPPERWSAMIEGQPELYRRGFRMGVANCGGGRDIER